MPGARGVRRFARIEGFGSEGDAGLDVESDFLKPLRCASAVTERASTDYMDELSDIDVAKSTSPCSQELGTALHAVVVALLEDVG